MERGQPFEAGFLSCVPCSERCCSGSPKVKDSPWRAALTVAHKASGMRLVFDILWLTHVLGTASKSR